LLIKTSLYYDARSEKHQITQNLYKRMRDQIFYVEHNDNSRYNEAVEMCHLKGAAGVQLQDINRSADEINRFTYYVALKLHKNFRLHY
jgi:hypothetical protein